MAIPSLYALLLLLAHAEAQLQVQIRRTQDLQNFSESELQNYSLLAEYTFPRAFSTDWFITSYANIPAEGITGLLYQPQPENGCSLFDTSQFRDDCSTNLSRISLLDDYHLCTAQKIRSNQEAALDAMITYSLGDRCRNVGDDVYDRSTGETVDVVASGIPVAVVSEEFYGELRSTATTRNCSAGSLTFISLSIGSINVNSIRSTLSALLVICGLLIVIAPLICCLLACLLCAKYFRKRRGSYDIHANQVHGLRELEGSRNVPQARGLHILPYTPEEREFHRDVEHLNIQCYICLEDFLEGEIMTALACDKNHTFHPKCINQWLDSKSTCPVCRTSIYS